MTTDNSQQILVLNWIFIICGNPCRFGEIALRNFVVKRLRQKYCLSEASLFLSSENDKILADLSAAASFFCFSFLRKKREMKLFIDKIQIFKRNSLLLFNIKRTK